MVQRLTRLLITPLGVGVLTVLGTLGVAAVLLALGGFDPLLAFRTLAAGALGSWDRLLSVTLVRAVPLILTGLGVALAFRAGVWNIGAEGQFYAGAVAATWFGLAAPELPLWVGLPAVVAVAGLAGMLWTLIPALMRSRLGVGEVITTILLNFVALNLVGWLVNGPLQESRGVFPQSDSVAEWARLPLLLTDSRLHLGFVVAVAACAGAALWLRHTRSGFSVQVTGLSEGAARVSGRIDTGRLQFRVFLVSGMLAGLAGGVEVSGVTYALYDNLSPGYGYTAIAVALLAGLNPWGVLAVGLLLGGLEGGAGAMQRDAGIPAVWVDGMEAFAILAVVALEGVRRSLVTRRRPAPSAAAMDLPAGNA
jgi:simple sugar transport system permease protein